MRHENSSGPPMQGEAQVVGRFHREGREGPYSHVLRGSLRFADGEITVLVYEGVLCDVLTGIGQDSVVRLAGRLVEQKWQVGSGRVSREIQLLPREVAVIEDSRRR